MLVGKGLGRVREGFGREKGTSIASTCKQAHGCGKDLGRVWEGFEKGLGRVWEGFGKGLGRVWEGVGKGLGRVWGGFGKGLGRIWARPRPRPRPRLRPRLRPGRAGPTPRIRFSLKITKMQLFHQKSILSKIVIFTKNM